MTIRDAVRSQHFGHLVRAYRLAREPAISQAAVGRWLGLSQAQVSRMEGTRNPPVDLSKLQRWAEALHVPAALLWFAAPAHALGESARTGQADSLEDVQRRDLLKMTAIAGSSLLSDAPWQRLAETLAGRRAAEPATVSMIEARTHEFYRTEETLPARDMVQLLRAHHRSLRHLIDSTANESLRNRLVISIGETEALAGWTFFDLQRPQQAIRLYRTALESAKQAEDAPLAACVRGFWSYLLSSKGDGPAAAAMLDTATDDVRGNAASTQAWLCARLAEERAAIGDTTEALRALDQAITIYDYATPETDRAWTSFFTPSRLGSLAVSTYGRLNHPETDQAAATLLSSMAPTENKVKALVMADLATSATKTGDYDRADSLASRSAQLATRTEASLAIDRLWEIVEALPKNNSGTAGALRRNLTECLVSSAK